MSVFKIVAMLKNGASVVAKPEMFVFPGGESQVRVPAELLSCAEQARLVRLEAHLMSADAVMQLLLLTDALRRGLPMVPLHLVMPYVPYARQDRVCAPGEALSAKVFCSLINAQGYASVLIADPHSDVVPALLERVSVIDASAYLAEVLAAPAFAGGVTLVAPDAGARKRTLALAKRFGVSDVAFADKVRDPLTGAISGVSFPQVPAGQPVLVVDDICDGGRTFLELAIAARRSSDVPLYLYVTHGIFSKGLAALAEHYTHIFTAHSWIGDAQNLTTLA